MALSIEEIENKIAVCVEMIGDVTSIASRQITILQSKESQDIHRFVVVFWKKRSNYYNRKLGFYRWLLRTRIEKEITNKQP